MQAQTVTHADTVSDTLDLSSVEKARVEMPYMAELTGKIPCGGGFLFLWQLQESSLCTKQGQDYRALNNHPRKRKPTAPSRHRMYTV